MTATTRVGVVGAGQMGGGFAELCALRGLDVTIVVSKPDAVSRARDRLIRALDRLVEKGKLTSEAAAAATARVAFTADFALLADRQLVLEAVPEDECVKAEVFRAMEKAIADPNAVIASTTSSIPIVRLAKAVSRPERVIGMHFFNPVPVLPLVEITPSLLTDPATVDAARTFAAEALGKEIVMCGDRSGFVVNTLLVPYLLAAVRMVDSGFATVEDIDRGMRSGCAHPMGPLRLLDLIGLDTIAAVADALYEEYREPQYVRPPLLSRMVDGGRLGRKSGRGFYEYP